MDYACDRLLLPASSQRQVRWLNAKQQQQGSTGYHSEHLYHCLFLWSLSLGRNAKQIDGGWRDDWRPIVLRWGKIVLLPYVGNVSSKCAPCHHFHNWDNQRWTILHKSARCHLSRFLLRRLPKGLSNLVVWPASFLCSLPCFCLRLVCGQTAFRAVWSLSGCAQPTRTPILCFGEGPRWVFRSRSFGDFPKMTSLSDQLCPCTDTQWLFGIMRASGRTGDRRLH